MITTPVAFLIFNRPDKTERVFAEIAKAKPSRLLVIADGPRPDKQGETEKCAAARAVIERVDWGCEVLKNYSDVNLGCKRCVSSGLDWVFDNVEEAIILEDDCLPGQSFFRFCQELLAYYRSDTRVMQICGLNVFKKWSRSGHSYFFSNYGPIWGWASWRRAWKYYDVDMKLWPEIKEKRLYEDFCQSSEEAEYRLDIYNKVYHGEIGTWDYQWGFAKMINHGLSIIPSVNQISNIGFDADATHTVVGQNNPYATMKTYDINFPLTYPKYVVRDCLADRRYLTEFMSIKPVRNNLRQTLLQLIHRAKI